MGTARKRRSSNGLPAALLSTVVFLSTLALPRPVDDQVEAECWEVLPDDSVVVVRVYRAGVHAGARTSHFARVRRLCR